MQDKASKQALDPGLKTHAKIKQYAFSQGLMLYPMGGTIDGVHGDHILLAPPFICTESDIQEIVKRLTQIIEHILPR